MSERKAFDRGMLAGVFLCLAADSGHWLITPMRHPDASGLRQTAGVVQMLACLGVALFLVVRRRPRAASSRVI